MASLFDPRYQAVDANGLPYSGALLYFYRAGTSSLVTVYQDSSAATPHTNPVVADSAGVFAPIYLSTTYPLKVILKTAAGVTLNTITRMDPEGYAGAAFDVQVDLLADRATYNAEAAGYSVLVSDVGDGRSAIYSKNSATSADWSDPAYLTQLPGMNWDGPWATATAYVVNDVVEEAGSAYICLVAHTSGTFATDLAAARWELLAEKGDTGDTGATGAVGVDWRGTYSGATAYVLNDGVLDNGSSWRALQATTGNAPPVLPTTSNAYWSLIAAKGTDGAGTGDVVGPASVADSDIAAFDGTTGKLIKVALPATARSTLGIAETYVTATGARTILATERGQFFRKTGSAATWAPQAAATCGDGWRITIKVEDNALTIDPQSAETIDGASTLIVSPGNTIDIWCNGTEFFSSLNVSNSALPARYWQGYQHSNSVGTPNTQIDIAAGSARDSTDALNIVNVAGTLNLATTGANGLDAGSLANSTWYYTFAITTAAGVTAFLASTSPTAPTLPGTYTNFRRIGSFKTNGSAQVLAFTHVNDLWFWETSPRDVNTSAQGTTLIAYPLSVPRVLGVEARGSVTFFAASTISPKMIPGFMGANAVNGGALSVGNVNGGSMLFNMPVDASAQVKIVSSAASTTIVVDTAGWRDTL